MAPQPRQFQSSDDLPAPTHRGRSGRLHPYCDSPAEPELTGRPGHCWLVGSGTFTLSSKLVRDSVGRQRRTGLIDRGANFLLEVRGCRLQDLLRHNGFELSWRLDESVHDRPPFTSDLANRHGAARS